jgi:hypothetical protein
MTEKEALDLAFGRQIVAFHAAKTFSPESRAAIAFATVLLTDHVFDDLAEVTAGDSEPNFATEYLPPSWLIGLSVGFMRGMAVAMVSVGHGLTVASWKGPANTAEELCLKAILDHAGEVVPDMFRLANEKRFCEDIDSFREVAFQDLDHEFLFQPEVDGVDKSELGERLGIQSLSRRDAFKTFANREGHLYLAQEDAPA